MAQLPGRRRARNISLVDSSREFDNIYDRMGAADEHGVRGHGLQARRGSSTSTR